jgi:hypothetical protein
MYGQGVTYIEGVGFVYDTPEISAVQGLCHHHQLMGGLIGACVCVGGGWVREEESVSEGAI